MHAVSTLKDIPDNSANATNQQIVGWLVAVAQKRDRNAFQMIYDHFAGRIKNYMIRHGADTAIADDLAQETMVQIWRKAEKYDATRTAPSAWIYRVARNLQIDQIRKQKLHEIPLTEEADTTDESHHGHERIELHPDSDKLKKLLHTLPDEQFDVVQLAYFDGLSHAEIGTHLSIPLGTVKSRMRLAFSRLRVAMGDQT